MANGLSQDITALIIDHTTSKGTFSQPTVYMALLTGAGASGSSTLSTMNEVTTGTYPGYARATVSPSLLGSAGISGGGLATNTGVIPFPTCTSGQTSAPVITGYALVDASTGTTGNILWYGTFGSSMTVNTGNQPSVAASNLQLALTTSGGSSEFLVKKVIDLTDGKTNYVPATPLYMALVTGTPAASQVAAATDITEPTSLQYTSYARVLIPAASWDHAAVSGGVASVSNNTPVTFPQSSAGTGATITGFALIEGCTTTPGSAGNILYWGTLTSQVISPNTTPFFNSGGLTIQTQ